MFGGQGGEGEAGDGHRRPQQPLLAAEPQGSEVDGVGSRRSRAAAVDREMVGAIGINVSWVFAFAFVLGANIGPGVIGFTCIASRIPSKNSTTGR